MRILMVNKYLYRRGGCEAYLFGLSNLLRKHGHVVDFFSTRHPDNTQSSVLERFFPPYPDYTSRSLPHIIRNSVDMLYSRQARSGFEQAIKDFRPDIVHLHNFNHQISPSILPVCAAYRIPVVMTLHDYKLVCPTYQLLSHESVCTECRVCSFLPCITNRCKGSILESILLYLEATLHHNILRSYDHINAFVAPSSFVRQQVVSAGIPSKKVFTIPHFIDWPEISEIEPTAKSGVVFIGRLSREKGIQVLLEAASMTPVTWTIVGDGPLRPMVEAAASTNPRIKYVGYMQPEAVRDLLIRSSVMVMPSVWHETFGMVALESYSCGTPVVASRMGALTEIVEDGQTGLLVEPNNPKALAQAVTALTTDHTRFKRFCKSALMKAREFSPERHYVAISDLYQRLVRKEAVTP